MPGTHRTKRQDPSSPTATDDRTRKSGVENVPGNARDREMGREHRPLGDLGHGDRTWTPPGGEQGMSNRAGDLGIDAELEADGEIDEFADEDNGADDDR